MEEDHQSPDPGCRLYLHGYGRWRGRQPLGRRTPLHRRCPERTGFRQVRKTDLHQSGRFGRDYANLTRANLPEANRESTFLFVINLSDANLINANLTRVNLAKANLTGAFQFKANLLNINLIQANLTEANLSLARYNGETKWPDIFDLVAAGAIHVE